MTTLSERIKAFDAKRSQKAPPWPVAGAAQEPSEELPQAQNAPTPISPITARIRAFDSGQSMEMATSQAKVSRAFGGPFAVPPMESPQPGQAVAQAMIDQPPTLTEGGQLIAAEKQRLQQPFEPGREPQMRRKGPGFWGTLQRPDGQTSTELSIGVEFDGKETEIPSLVPTLTRAEVDHMLAGNKPTLEIVRKAVEHAKKRMAEGKDVFAQEGEQAGQTPGVIQQIGTAIAEAPENLKIGTVGLAGSAMEALERRGRQMQSDFLAKAAPGDEKALAVQKKLLMLGSIMPTTAIGEGRNVAAVPPTPQGPRAEDAFAAAGESLRNRQGAMAAEQDQEAIRNAPITRIARQTIQGGVPSAVVSIGAAILTRNPLIGLGILGETTGGQEWKEQMKAGASPLKAEVLASLAEAAEIGGEALVLPKFVKGLTHGIRIGDAIALVAENYGQEFATGLAQGWLNEFGKLTSQGVPTAEAARKALDPAWENAKQSGIVGAATAGLIDVASMPASVMARYTGARTEQARPEPGRPATAPYADETASGQPTTIGEIATRTTADLPIATEPGAQIPVVETKVPIQVSTTRRKSDIPHMTIETQPEEKIGEFSSRRAADTWIKNQSQGMWTAVKEGQKWAVYGRPQSIARESEILEQQPAEVPPAPTKMTEAKAVNVAAPKAGVREAPREPTVPAEAAPAVAAGVPEVPPGAQVERALPETATAKPAEAVPVVAPQAGEVGKQSWEMNRQEFAKSHSATYDMMEALKGKIKRAVISETKIGKQVVVVPSGGMTDESRWRAVLRGHEKIIKQAVRQGKPVPRHVLEEYKSEPWAAEALAKLGQAERGEVPERMIQVLPSSIEKPYEEAKGRTPTESIPQDITDTEKRIAYLQDKIAKGYGTYQDTDDLGKAQRLLKKLQKQIVPPAAPETKGEKTADKDALIERIVAAARMKPLEIVERNELKGTDGKWYAGDFPTGVKYAGEKRPYFVSLSEEGTTVGKRYPTREAGEAANREFQARRDEEFRQALREMNAKELARQETYWITEQAEKRAKVEEAMRVISKKGRGKPAAEPKATKPVPIPRRGRKLLPAQSIADFEVGRDKVERRGDRTFIVDVRGEHAPIEVQSDAITDEVRANLAKLRPDQLTRMEQETRQTPYLSEEGRQERLAAIADLRKPSAPEGGKGTAGRMGSPGTLGQASEIDVGRLKVSMEPKAEPTSARNILDYVRRSFAVPMKGKATHKMRIYAGWFDAKALGIRLKDVRNLSTAVHEIGHYIDWHLNKRWSLKPPSPEINKELLTLGKALYGKRKPSGGYKSEGWAEFMREYITGEDAQTKAPALFDFFEKDYLPGNPDVAEKIGAVKQMVADFRFQGAEARIESQINRADIKGSLGEQAMAALQWTNTAFRTELAPLQRVVSAVRRELKPSEDPYQLAVAFTSKAPAKAREFVLTGTTDMAGNRVGPSLREAVSGIDRKDFRTFTRWIYAKEALFRWSEGKNPGIAKADAQYVYDKYKSPEWEKAATAVTKWNREVLDYLTDAGGFDPKIRDLLRNTPIYIPLFRAFAKSETKPMGLGTGRSIAQPSKPVKRMKGSGGETIDPFESMIQQAERFISVAHKAMVAKSLAAVANEPGMAGWIWKVPAPQEAVKFTSEKIKNDIRRIAVQRLGLDPSEIPTDFNEPWDDLITIWQNASQYYGKDNIVSLFVDGKRQWFEVHPDLYRAIEGLDQYSLPWYLGILGKANRAVRLGATGLNPAFGLVRNFIRDAMTMLVTAEHAHLGPISSVKGVIKDIAGTEGARRFKAMGGEMAGQILNDRIATQRLRDELTGNWMIKTVHHPIEAIRELFGITELGPRIEEFDKALEYAEQKYGKGTLDASIYALNAAQDVTTNFTRHGSIGKVLNEMIPFFNASIMGPEKVIRTFGKHPYRSSAIALAGLTLPAVLLWWLVKDEDWYDHLSDVEKANYLHFRVPGTEKIVRMPVPFELGYVFQALPVAVLDRMYRKDKGQVMDIFKIAAERSNPLDWPAAVGPAIDVMTNRSWTGAPIVSEAMKGKLPEDRSRVYTTSPMRYLGRLLGVAPVQLEYLVNSYSGGLYDRIGRTGDVLMGKAQSLEAADIPVVGTLFVRQSDRPNEKLDRFYRRLDLLNQKAGSKKITVAEMYERRELSAAGRDLSELRKQIEEPKISQDVKNGVYRRMDAILDLAFTSDQPSRIDLMEQLADITYEDYRAADMAKWIPHKGQEEKVSQIKKELGRVTAAEYDAWRTRHREIKQEESLKRREATRENEKRKRSLRTALIP